MKDLKKILNYTKKLPIPVANLLLKINILGENLFGKAYKNYKYNRIIKNYNKFDNTTELITIVNKAIKDVPFYKNKYKTNIKSIDDFKSKIKFTDKIEVMANFDDFISTKINWSKYIEGTTGGTSGKPLKLITPKNRYIFELATMHLMWKTTGWNYHKRAVIRNHKLPVNKNFVIDPLTREFIFDNFRLDDNYMMIIYKTIKKYNLQFIHAYPSAAYQFAKFIKNNNLNPSIIKAFFSGSENIFDYQRKLIQEELGIRFYNWFGHSEKLILGGYCEHTNNYHIEPTYGYVELIDENGENITETGKIGEIVGTTLHNSGMPLIRYKTGDFAEFVANKCESCGRELLVIKNIKGRWSGEKVYNRNGSFVTTTALNLHDDIYSVINGIQYIQKEKGSLELLIVKTNKYTTNHENRLIKHFKSKFTPDFLLQIKYVDKLIIQQNGKFLLLISSINK